MFFPIRRLTFVSIDLYPATADKRDEQFVMMTLKFTLDSEVSAL